MGGIFSKPKVPAAPDPAATAQAQAEANRVTQFTPSGNLLYGTVGAGGQFVPANGTGQTALQVQETPFQESLRGLGESEILNLAQQLQGTTLGDVRTASSIEGMSLPGLQTDFATETQRLEDSTFQAATQRLQPQFDRQRAQLEQRLADQGLPIGSDAYEQELSRMEESQNEQLSRLSLDAVAQGRAEQDRLARLSAALRGQALNEQFGLSSLEQQARQQSFGELGSLLGFNTPFSQQSTPFIDVAGIAQSGYQGQLAQSQAQQQAAQQQASNIAGVGQLAAFAFSDIRLKENVKLVKSGAGYNLYEFNYIGDSQRYRGVMAHEIESILPEAVTEIDGYKAVNYAMLGEKMEAVCQ